MNSLKVGVLTFHRCINYGSFWQAKCLVEGLRKRGYDTTILNHDSRMVNIAEWKCALQPVLPGRTAASDHVQYKEKARAFFKAIQALPLSASFRLDKPDEMEDFDLIIVGSDEVWNLFHPWYNRYPVFFGANLKAKCLIAYAASFGNYPAGWGLQQNLAGYLRNFGRISVRDINSQKIIESALGVRPDIVLDPCLQFPDERVGECNRSRQPFVAVYGHSFTEEFIRLVKQWAKRKKLPLISIGYKNEWADEQWIDAGPYDFSHFIKEANCIVTNFFHGCVFAIRYEQPFVCESSPYRANKIQDLLTLTGAQKHLISGNMPSEVLNDCLGKAIDPAILDRVKDLRRTSDEYLDQALAIKHLEAYGTSY